MSTKSVFLQDSDLFRQQAYLGGCWCHADSGATVEAKHRALEFSLSDMRTIAYLFAATKRLRPLLAAMKSNPHRGSDFEDFLKAQGIYEEVMASPKLKRAIRNLATGIQAEMHEAFQAGWNAFLATHSGLLIAHGIKDFRLGFEQAWTKYWQSRKG
jgi:hypothetical protein